MYSGTVHSPVLCCDSLKDVSYLQEQKQRPEVLQLSWKHPLYTPRMTVMNNIRIIVFITLAYHICA